jgi:flagellar hook-length control protein FliK
LRRAGNPESRPENPAPPADGLRKNNPPTGDKPAAAKTKEMPGQAHPDRKPSREEKPELPKDTVETDAEQPVAVAVPTEAQVVAAVLAQTEVCEAPEVAVDRGPTTEERPSEAVTARPIGHHPGTDKVVPAANVPHLAANAKAPQEPPPTADANFAVESAEAQHVGSKETLTQQALPVVEPESNKNDGRKPDRASRPVRRSEARAESASAPQGTAEVERGANPTKAASAPDATVPAPTTADRPTAAAAPSPKQADVAAAAAPVTTAPSAEQATARSRTDAASGVAEAKRGGEPANAAERTTPARPGKSDTMSHVDRARFVQRVSRAFHAIGEDGGQIRLRLSPPELGSLRLEVTLRDGVMTARLEAETVAAHTVLSESLPQLRERLAEQGIQVERFDIDLMNQSSTGSREQFAGSDSREQRSPAVMGSSVKPTAPDAATETTARRSRSGSGELDVLI